MTTHEVSDHGRLRNLKTGRIIGSVSPQGYMNAALCKDGVAKNISIHVLTAEVFCKMKRGCTQVDHIDGNRLNNHYKNLEWVSPKENSRRAVANGRMSKSTRRRPVRVKFVDGTWYLFPSVTSVAKRLDVDVTAVHNRLNGKQKSLKGIELIMYANAA